MLCDRIIYRLCSLLTFTAAVTSDAGPLAMEIRLETRVFSLYAVRHAKEGFRELLD